MPDKRDDDERDSYCGAWRSEIGTPTWKYSPLYNLLKLEPQDSLDKILLVLNQKGTGSQTTTFTQEWLDEAKYVCIMYIVRHDAPN